MKRWPFEKLVVLGLIFGFATLMADLRYDHNHVMRKHAAALIPIYYSGGMALLGVICLTAWDSWGRRALIAFFAAGIVVGLLGYWFHNSGHLVSGLRLLFSVWTGKSPDPVAKPPVLAPLAFAGMGALGILACTTRCNSPRAAAP
ncbi:MAG TPA: hypothetical protein VGM37_06655 [Armatimonadota bacterium]|jgi:NhaP-type Na+/H+ or K+/H+ antiporter